MEILATSRPARTTRPPAHRLLEPLRIVSNQPTLPWDDPPVISQPAELDPALRRLVTAVFAAIIEALAGQRPVAQLEGRLEVEPLELLEHLRRAGIATGIRLRSLRLQCPSPDAVEAAAHLRLTGASRAAALRLARRDDRWVVTRLELALLPDVVSRAGWPPLPGPVSPAYRGRA